MDPNEPWRMTLNEPTNSNPKAAPQAPAALAELAFLAIRDVCAVTRMSASWIHEEVRSGRFPPPLRFGPRCSRWRTADVREWLVARSESITPDAAIAALVTKRAKKASDAAQAKRRATTTEGVSP